MKTKRWHLDFPNPDDPDGSAGLLFILDGNPKTYQEWSQKYYERPVRIDLVEAIYRQEPLTRDLVAGLNQNITVKDLEDDAIEIGYVVVST
ncbi:MAG: hypothetical protein AB1489_30545 [Acidobacteriota bacterium]